VLGGCLGFFFSSRRRHTRLVSDWSSDVCSSDLSRPSRLRALIGKRSGSPRLRAAHGSSQGQSAQAGFFGVQIVAPRSISACAKRSEERRVGKEGRSRWAAERSKKREASRSVERA